ncbi:MAG: cytochrome c [Thermoleophilia bacterium]|nr:cytochrome c [Thermoleophilia bacterium]
MRRTRLVALVLVLALGLLAAGCLDGTETTATADKVVGVLPTTTTTTGDLPALELMGDAAAGKAVFTSQSCGSCHVLAASGTSGAVGPNLDESKPSTELVVTRVTEGKSLMPAFGETLTAQQIADVAAYVSESTGG